MELTLGLDIICPNCKKELEVETGLLGGLFMSSVIESLKKRLDKEGGNITCGHCKVRSRIEPKPKPDFNLFNIKSWRK